MERKNFINGIRSLADLFENNPSIPTPDFGIDVMVFLDGELEDQKQTLANLARDLKPAEKEFLTFHAGILLRNEVWKLHILVRRESICRRKVETKVIPEKVFPATQELVIPAHKEEVVTWECDPILSGEGE